MRDHFTLGQLLMENYNLESGTTICKMNYNLLNKL